MKSWHDNVRFPQPLRHVRVAALTTRTALQAADHQQQIQASYERGKIDGTNALRQELLQQRTDIQQLLNGVIQSLKQTVPQVVRDSEQALLTLAVEIAQKVIGQLPITADMVEATVRDALTHVEGATEMHVRLHPDDLALLRALNSDLLTEDAQTKGLAFHPSPDVTRGGCLVQTRFGVFDARRETKLDLVKQSLLA